MFEFQRADGRVIKVRDSAVFGEVTQPLFAVGTLWKCGWGIDPKDAYTAFLKKGNVKVPIRFVRNSTVTDLRIYRAEARTAQVRKLTVDKDLEEDLEAAKLTEGWCFLRSGQPARIDWHTKYTYNLNKMNLRRSSTVRR